MPRCADIAARAAVHCSVRHIAYCRPRLQLSSFTTQARPNLLHTVPTENSSLLPATAKTSLCPGHTALYVLGPHGSAEMSALVAPPVSTGGARGARSYHSSSRATPATQDRTDMVQGGSPAIALGRCCFCFVHCTLGKEVIFNLRLAIKK